MARRPKRSLAEELTQHARIADAAADLVAALAVLQPDIPEFIVAERMLADGCTLLLERRRETEAAAAPEPAQSSLPVAP